MIPTALMILGGLFTYITYDIWAYRTDKAWTLSHLIYWLSLKWPLFAPIVASIMGGLYVHFFL